MIAHTQPRRTRIDAAVEVQVMDSQRRGPRRRIFARSVKYFRSYQFAVPICVDLESNVPRFLSVDSTGIY